MSSDIRVLLLIGGLIGSSLRRAGRSAHCAGSVGQAVQETSRSAWPDSQPWAKTSSSIWVKISAGPSGSVDWRTANRPSGSFLTSTQLPPLLPLHGLCQPSEPSVRTALCMRFTYLELLANAAEKFRGALYGQGLRTHPVQRLPEVRDVVVLVEVHRPHQVLDVDDVRDLRVREAEDVERPVHALVRADPEGHDLDLDVRLLQRLDQA